ncbi:hypothetical protein [Ulvibacterium marinum]|uniref:hypothetical protein n=1 Tax=Ulvibacterium marinum TaxID=2419782 RepID=UPI002494A60E|nr:hypothetical protein [Ulvibacterium marinum]
MIDKLKYYEALKLSNGRLNEIELVEKLGMNEARTRELIAILLSEYKIAYAINGYCNYSIFSKARARPNSGQGIKINR